MDDYAACVELLDETDADMIELNISCPNVAGKPIGTDTKTTETLTNRIRKITNKPIIVKLSPNVTSISDIALAAEAGGADAVSLINCPMGMRINIQTRKPMLANITGGMSGPAIFPLALRMVWQTAKAVKISVLGGGGIVKWEDAVEMMMAGADAVFIGAGLFYDPATPLKVIEGLEKYCLDNDLSNVSMITDSLITDK